nr:hypothetical protein [Naasia sp. SYSU D00057]
MNYGPPGQGRPPVRSEDEIAIERYRYLLRTAPPETIEQVHAEAFAQLTPEQRRLVFEELRNGPEAPAGDDPASLARSATRSEFRQPGFLERRFSGGGAGGGGFGGGGFGGGPSFGTILGGSLLGTVAGYVVGSALVSAFLPDPSMGDYGGADAADAADGGDAGAEGGDAGGDYGGDGGGGWDTSDGGFFGGGDFGGGDFGGGDFGGGDF